MQWFVSVARKCLRLAAACLVLGAALAARQVDEDLATLWRIGEIDGDTADLALGRDGYDRFAGDGLFVPGLSEAKRDWPYVHPGPSDAWAGGRAHTFSVLFAIEGEAAVGPARLVVVLADTHDTRPPRLVVRINGREVHAATTPRGGGDASIYGEPARGTPHTIDVAIPEGVLRVGDNALEIENSEGSWVLYDGLRLDVAGDVGLAVRSSLTVVQGVTSVPALVERDGALLQPLNVDVVHFGEERMAFLTLDDGATTEVVLQNGRQTFRVLVPEVEAPTDVTLRVRTDEEVLGSFSATLAPVRKWTLYLMHHTHLDIGYTHTQGDVEKLQMGYLDQVLDLIDATDDYPPAARFKWMPEGLWPVDSWLAAANAEQHARFVTAVREGRIGLDALYGNALTGLYSEEELFALVDYAVRLRGEYGFEIDSAMISDLPGWTWGLAAVLAECGVRYLSTGPNISHRIGHTRKWDDRPVWWETPDGQDRILFWQAGKYGYAWFHGWVHPDNRGENKLTERRFFEYLAELEEKNYPYDYVQIRYNIGADNGPPDPHLSDSVRKWNEEHAWPKIVIATTSEMFHAFEERYGDELPTVRGDFTPYWEDGAASTAADTAANRRATEKLLQAQALWAMLSPGPFPDEWCDGAWQNAVLYDEHTWGAHNSISEPDSEFARSQAAHKQAFALDAEAEADALIRDATAARRSSDPRVYAVEVFNTLSWPRTALVVLPAEWTKNRARIEVPPRLLVRGLEVEEVMSQGYVPTQRLHDGRLAFLARDLPPMGSLVYWLEPGGPTNRSPGKGSMGLGTEGNLAWNQRLRITLDERTGAIARIETDHTIRDIAGEGGFDRYVYVPGRDPGVRQEVDGVRITAIDVGPVLVTLRVESDAPGAHGLVREYTLFRDLPRIDVVNHLDKEQVRDKEAVYFVLALDFPSPCITFDQPWGAVQLGRDQAENACRNFFSVGRWVELLSEDCGATLATVDAPLMQMGDIHTDVKNPYAPWVWLEDLEPSSTLFSYVMNNYWETNYAASQEGPTTFRYSLLLHGPEHDAARASRFGIEACRPPVVIPVPRQKAESLWPFLLVKPVGVRVTALKPTRDGKAVLVRLFNETGASVQAEVRPGDAAAWHVHASDAFETRGDVLDGAIRLPANGILTLRLERAE